MKMFCFLIALTAGVNAAHGQCNSGRCNVQTRFQLPNTAFQSALNIPSLSTSIENQPDRRTKPPKLLASAFFASTAAEQRVRESSVSIQLPSGRHALSGHIIGLRSDDIATILTAAHQLPDQPVILYATGQQAQGTVVAVSRQYDVAVVMARSGRGVQALPIKKYPSQYTGDRVAHVGFGKGNEYRVSAGEIVGHVSIEHDGLSEPKYLASSRRGLSLRYDTKKTQLAITGDIRPGDSGGAIVNQHGELLAAVWGNSDPEESRVYGTDNTTLTTLLDRAKQVAGLTWDMAEDRRPQHTAASDPSAESNPHPF
tara:strand:+ start:6725 stop:7660 length:936 start_codon:yes stop_codon:yes gene_type:complete